MNKTSQIIKSLFPTTKDIDSVVAIIEKYKDKFGLNTDLRLKHFLAQVREEIGSNFVVKRENLNYTKDALIKTFKVFKDNPELADKYGRYKNTSANQEAIANLAYANRLGNGNVDSADGFKYRGAGCLQITGKSNFAEVQKRCVKYAGKEMDPDTLEGFIVFGMAYWIWHDLYRLADEGASDSVVDKITAKINRYTDSYDKRKVYFRLIKDI